MKKLQLFEGGREFRRAQGNAGAADIFVMPEKFDCSARSAAGCAPNFILPFLLPRKKIKSQLSGNKASGFYGGGHHFLTPGESSGIFDFSSYVERVSRAVLILDLVESVRLIERDERSSVSRWLKFVRHIEESILPKHRGRLVKSLGDGLLLDFDTVRAAVAAAIECQAFTHAGNAAEPPDRHFLLRIGIEAADVFDDGRDIYGHGVNLAARLMTLADPGAIVISSQARDQLTPELDADVEDLGNCYVRNVSKPIRAYRVGSLASKSASPVNWKQGGFSPTIAVLPFLSRVPSDEQHVLGDVLADELIRAFSVSQYLGVISHLSTSSFRRRAVNIDVVAVHLNANYVLSGNYLRTNGQIRLFVELSEVASSKVLWSDAVESNIKDILSGDQELISEISNRVSTAVIARELQKVRTHFLPTLENHSLLMGAIALMHRMSFDDFQVSFEMLSLIAKRASRHAEPHAWIAKWYVLRAQQGWSDDPERDAYLALQATRRALDADPDSSLALTIDGLVHTHILKQHDVAGARYELAIEKNPNNSLAWLLKGTEHAFIGDGVQAVEDTQRAIRLSPLDPHRYYYDSLAATAYLANHQFDKALEFAVRSLRSNKTHTSSLRAKAVACWQLAKFGEARAVLAELMALEPNFSVRGWLARSPSADHAIGREWARVFKKIGAPD